MLALQIRALGWFRLGIWFPDVLLILCVVSRGGCFVQCWKLAVPQVRISVVLVCSLQLNGVEPPSAWLSLGLARATDSSLHETPQGPQNQLALAAVAWVLGDGGADGYGCEWNLTQERLWLIFGGFLFPWFVIPTSSAWAVTADLGSLILLCLCYQECKYYWPNSCPLTAVQPCHLPIKLMTSGLNWKAGGVPAVTGDRAGLVPSPLLWATGNSFPAGMLMESGG